MALVGDAQARDAGPGRGDDGAGDGGDRGGAGSGVVADFLDAQQAPVGSEADLPQLAATLLAFTHRYNQAACPFNWKYTAADLAALRARISEPGQTTQQPAEPAQAA